MTLQDAVKAAGKLGLKITGIPAFRKTLPKSKMGSLVDEYRDIKELRLAASKVVEAIEDEEKRILNHIIENVDADSNGVMGLRYKAEVKREQRPTVEDWEKFYAHVKKTGAFDLLQRRLNDAAVKERLEDKKGVPGVGTFQVKKLSVTKI